MADYNVNNLVKVSGLKAVATKLKNDIDALNQTYAPLGEFNTVKTKVAGIEEGAQVNVIESITIDGTAQNITGKAVALNLSNYAKKSDIASMYKVKGSVNSFAELPTNAEVGDVYNIATAGGTDENGTAVKAGDNVVKTSTGWDNLGGTADLSNYVEKETGKGLSTNDYTTTEKNKLAGIEAGAQVNVLEGVKLNGTALTPDANKAVNIDTSNKADKVTGATQGNIVVFGADGNIADTNLAVASDADITAMITEVFGSAG